MGVRSEDLSGLLPSQRPTRSAPVYRGDSTQDRFWAALARGCRGSVPGVSFSAVASGSSAPSPHQDPCIL